jgi:hypothetical protein
MPGWLFVVLSKKKKHTQVVSSNLAAATIELPCYLGNVSGTCVKRVDLNGLC